MCLPEQEHTWKRFLLPSGTVANLDREFLPDPDDEYGSHYNPAARAFSSLRDKPLLAVLGASGLGKSDVFAKEVAAIGSEEGTEYIALLCRVSDYASSQQIES